MAQLSSLRTLVPKPDLGRVQPWLRGALTRNVGFKVLSVIFAFAGWAWVQGEQVVEQKARVELDWTLPENLTLVDDVPDSLSLTVSGSQVFVRNVRRADLRMRVDLSDASKGVQSVSFEDRNIDNLPQNVHVVGLSPTRVEFELDETATKRVKVTPVTVGDPVNGYRLVDVDVQPATVELEGPASVLVGIVEVPTSVVDIGGFQSAAKKEVLLGRLPAGVTRLGEAPIEVGVRVEPVTTNASFEAVPVRIHTDGWATDVESVSLTLSGPLVAVNAIEAEDLMVLVSIGEEAQAAGEPLLAKLEDGPARYKVIRPYTERVSVIKVAPGNIEVRPAP